MSNSATEIVNGNSELVVSSGSSEGGKIFNKFNSPSDSSNKFKSKFLSSTFLT